MRQSIEMENTRENFRMQIITYVKQYKKMKLLEYLTRLRVTLTQVVLIQLDQSGDRTTALVAVGLESDGDQLVVGM